MTTVPFVGRKRELKELELLLQKKSASLVVIEGRRRIGKSRLIQEFGRGKKFYQFTGNPPSQTTTAQSQRDTFSLQLASATILPEIKADDWDKLFQLLSQTIEQGNPVILFDEISWMGSKDAEFLGKLKTAWDLYFKPIPGLILILCGSVSPWIEKNILSSTGFFGRFSSIIKLNPLPLKDCNSLLQQVNFKDSAYEKFKILSVTGGVPRYLEEIQGKLTAEENIRRLCFRPNSILLREFEDIFSDLFSQRSHIYKGIVRILANGAAEYNAICAKLSVQKSGHMSEVLDDLVKSGFISRDFTWHIATGRESSLSVFRLSDNYLRFYLKYIEKNRSKIIKEDYEDVLLSSHPGWESILGLQFENLVVNNRRLLIQSLGVRPEEIVCDNPFFQHKTSRQSGCQIDYLVQTKYKRLYVCEVKFSHEKIDSGVIGQMENKISRLKTPKGFSCFPVLIHVNGISRKVQESGYFSHIIDFCEFLE